MVQQGNIIRRLFQDSQKDCKRDGEKDENRPRSVDCVIFLCYIYVSNWSDLVSQCSVMQGLFLFAFFTSFKVSETLCKRQNGNILVTLVTLVTLETLRTLRTLRTMVR